MFKFDSVFKKAILRKLYRSPQFLDEGGQQKKVETRPSLKNVLTSWYMQARSYAKERAEEPPSTLFVERQGKKRPYRPREYEMLISQIIGKRWLRGAKWLDDILKEIMIHKAVAEKLTKLPKPKRFTIKDIIEINKRALTYCTVVEDFLRIQAVAIEARRLFLQRFNFGFKEELDELVSLRAEQDQIDQKLARAEKETRRTRNRLNQLIAGNGNPVEEVGKWKQRFPPMANARELTQDARRKLEKERAEGKVTRGALLNLHETSLNMWIEINSWLSHQYKLYQLYGTTFSNWAPERIIDEMGICRRNIAESREAIQNLLKKR
jgi:hypothetical protein